MRKKKIQIYYASIGSGHLVAARSIASSLQTLDKTLDVEMRDIFKNTRGNTYIQELLALIPSFFFPNLYSWIWKTGAFKWVYHLATKIGPWQYSIIKALENEKPDLVICTHTYPCSVVSGYKKSHPEISLIAVPTDLFIHHFWPLNNVDAFIAPNELTKDELIRRGFNKQKIYMYGIPVSSELKKYIKIKKHTQQSHPIIITVLAGSYRVAPYYSIHTRVRKIIEYLEKNQDDSICWQFIFGAAQKFKENATLRLAERRDIKILDFPDNVQKIIAQSDLIFAKPGGLTVAEAISMKKPIILLSRGAGQERANSEYVVSSRTGILLDADSTLEYFLKKLYSNPTHVFKFYQPSKIDFSNSSERIARLAQKML